MPLPSYLVRQRRVRTRPDTPTYIRYITGKLTDVHCICTQSPGSPSVLDMPARSLREQGDFATAQPRAREAEFLAPGLRVSAFDCGEVLREARGDVGCFREGELFCPVVQWCVCLE